MKMRKSEREMGIDLPASEGPGRVGEGEGAKGRLRDNGAGSKEYLVS
ncbi:hypothetical protein ES705_32684 [subsurface metagenome]